MNFLLFNAVTRGTGLVSSDAVSVSVGVISVFAAASR